jgi:hypothetical protein
MEPTYFDGYNCVYAKDQPEYLPLPVYKVPNDETGLVVSCWRLSFWDRVRALLFGRLYLQVLTFNHPLQPLLPMTYSPFVWSKEEKDGGKGS